MTSLLERIDKPQYFFRPVQMLSRFGRDADEVILPWGSPIRVPSDDIIGRAIRRLGVYDLTLSEALWRLTGKCETVVDAGANIGYVTSLFASRVGAGGHVLAFEPHPEVFDWLQRNTAICKGAARIDLILAGLSDRQGRARLRISPEFAGNCGVTQLDPDDAGDIELTQLDQVIDSTCNVGVLKIDVEGHELEVLRGASALLGSRRIRDIVFEDFHPQPGPCAQLLGQYGYSLWRVGRSFVGPRLLPVDADRGFTRWEPPSFLATREPVRAMELFAHLGWQVLSGRSR